MAERREPRAWQCNLQWPMNQDPKNVFAFLPGDLTGIIKISIHFCNKCVLRDCSKDWWRSWRQDDRNLTFRRLKGDVYAQTQWVPIQVPKLAL